MTTLNQSAIDSLLTKHNKTKRFPITKDDFIADCLRYIKATKEGRMICSIDKVSASGMSRTMKFVELSKEKGSNRHFILNFYNLFDTLGFTAVNHSDYFRIAGCGMNMVFATNYDIIHELKHLGFISEKECSDLAQRTPSVI